MATVTTRPPRRTLTAAASVRKIEPGKIPDIRQEGWQERMWHFYRHLGAVHYGINFKKNAASKVTYFAAEKTDWDPEPTENQVVIDAVDRLRSRFGGLKEIVAELMVHLNVPGEGYLVGQAGLEGEDWDVWSVQEYKRAASAVASVLARPDMAVIEGDVFAARIWRPDPEDRTLADSPLRPVAEQCDQLLLLEDSVSAAAKSRLSAGLLKVPSELDIGDQEAFEDELIAILTTPIRETDTASRWAPGLLRGPAEFLAQVEVLSFERGMDATFANMRDELTSTIATGLDLPAEIILGKSDINHWTSWEIDESAFRDHIDPDIILILDSITRGYLHPALQEAGVENFDDYLIWRDLSDLGQRPPTIPEATGLYDRGLLSGDYMRGLINASDEDAPEEGEVTPVTALEPVEAEGVGISRGEPGQEPAATSLGIESETLASRINAVGTLIRSGFDPEASLAALGLPAITHLGYLPVTIKTDAPPDPSAAVLDPNAPEPVPASAPSPPEVSPLPEGEALVAAEPKKVPLYGLARIDEVLFEKIAEATEAAFGRVMERAGAKVRSHARKDRGIAMSIDRVPNDQVTRHLGEKLVSQLQITPGELVPDDSFDPLTKRLRTIFEGAVAAVAEELEFLTGTRPEIDNRKIQGAIGHYVTELKGFSLNLLFSPFDPGPGEVGDAQVPAGMVIDMMTEAGGSVPTSGPSEVRGFATGQDSVEYLQTHGVVLAGHLWDYGDVATRRRPFPPHRKLDGTEFTDWTDERLSTPASAQWLNVGHMFPGDHYRCQCRTIPMMIQPPASLAVRDLSTMEVEAARFDAVTFDFSTRSDPWLQKLWKRAGYDRPGQVVSRAGFDALEGVEYQRGIHPLSGGKAEALRWAEDLRTGNYFPGTGMHGNGTYAVYGETLDRVAGYAGPDGAVVRFKLKPDANVIDSKDLDRIMDDYLEGLAARTDLDEAARTRLREVAEDPGRFATMQGYDAIEVKRSNYLVLLNRTMAIFEEAI